MRTRTPSSALSSSQSPFLPEHSGDSCDWRESPSPRVPKAAVGLAVTL
ncbi:hypothetical protein [Haladaptatus halobius]|nr:hypothetical protein [Haladaptatus halobius]